MKKILSIALVALLAASAVFAAEFSGSASVGLGYNFEKKTYGFSNSNSAEIEIETEYTSANVDEVAEGDIYAGIKASFLINFVADSDEAAFDIDTCEVEEAYVTNGVWKLSVLGAGAGVDYAKSAIDTYWDGAARAYKPITFEAPFGVANGVTLSYNGWTVGAGFDGDASKEIFNYSAIIETPEIALEGLTVQAAAYASDATTSEESEYDEGYMLDITTGEIVQINEDWEPVVTYTREVAVGASAKVAYGEIASVAADFAYDVAAKTVDFDVAATAAYDVVTVNAYYNYGKKLLSANASASIDPVSLTVTAMDILGKKNLSVKASADLSDALAVSASASYVLANNNWSVSGSATYKADAFTAKAGATFNYVSADAMQLYANASIESSSVLPGATLKLSYSPIAIPLSRPTAYTTNLLNGKYGKIDATCKIEF